MQVFKSNDTIEGYRVMSEIGRGAASVVYLVQDPKTKQIWALKHVEKTEDAKDSRFLEQAELEYQIASKLQHTGIRRIEKIIKKKESMLSAVSAIILLMEFVDGISLEKKPPKTFDSAADVFEQVARSMAYMHTRGFVHADMKPNNVIIDAEGKIKLVDLGQSCAMSRTLASPSSGTSRGPTPRPSASARGSTSYCWACSGPTWWASTPSTTATTSSRPSSGPSKLGSSGSSSL